MEAVGGVSSALPFCESATCCAATHASIMAVYCKAAEPPRRVVEPEVASMCAQQDLMIAVAEEVLCTKVVGKGQWCISWLEWF